MKIALLSQAQTRKKTEMQFRRKRDSVTKRHWEEEVPEINMIVEHVSIRSSGERNEKSSNRKCSSDNRR